jgi:hypothetical protein
MAISTLIVIWFLVTAILTQRFVSTTFYDLASRRYEEKKCIVAEKNLSIAIAIDPVDSNFYYLNSLILLEQFKESKDRKLTTRFSLSAEKAVELNYHTPYLHKNYAGVLFFNKDYWGSFVQLKWADFLIPYVKKYSKDVDKLKTRIIGNQIIKSKD